MSHIYKCATATCMHHIAGWMVKRSQYFYFSLRCRWNGSGVVVSGYLGVSYTALCYPAPVSAHGPVVQVAREQPTSDTSWAPQLWRNVAASHENGHRPVPQTWSKQCQAAYYWLYLHAIYVILKLRRNSFSHSSGNKLKSGYFGENHCSMLHRRQEIVTFYRRIRVWWQ